MQGEMTEEMVQLRFDAPQSRVQPAGPSHIAKARRSPKRSRATPSLADHTCKVRRDQYAIRRLEV